MVLELEVIELCNRACCIRASICTVGMSLSAGAHLHAVCAIHTRFEDIPGAHKIQVQKQSNGILTQIRYGLVPGPSALASMYRELGLES